MRTLAPVLAASALVLLGCAGLVDTFTAAEIGRIPMSANGSSGSATAAVVAGPVALWTDLDVSWEGSAAMVYRVQVSQNGATIADTVCDPLDVNVTLNSVTTDMGSSHSRDYDGLMGCTVVAPADGTIEVSAVLEVTGDPLIERADLVIKQAQ